jgi:hypothetical protein
MRNFREDLKGEVPRILLPRTSVITIPRTWLNKAVYSFRCPIVTNSNDKNRPFGGCANTHNLLTCSCGRRM